MVTLDLNHLKKIVGDDPDFLRQVLQIFITNSPKDLEELSTFANEGDHEKVAFFAHRLKSAAAAIGFEEAYEAFKEIELESKKMEALDNLPVKVNAMKLYCEQCITDIESVMKSL